MSSRDSSRPHREEERQKNSSKPGTKGHKGTRQSKPLPPLPTTNHSASQPARRPPRESTNPLAPNPSGCWYSRDGTQCTRSPSSEFSVKDPKLAKGSRYFCCETEADEWASELKYADPKRCFAPSTFAEDSPWSALKGGKPLRVAANQSQAPQLPATNTILSIQRAMNGVGNPASRGKEPVDDSWLYNTLPNHYDSKPLPGSFYANETTATLSKAQKRRGWLPEQPPDLSHVQTSAVDSQYREDSFTRQNYKETESDPYDHTSAYHQAGVVSFNNTAITGARSVPRPPKTVHFGTHERESEPGDWYDGNGAWFSGAHRNVGEEGRVSIIGPHDPPMRR